MPARSGGNCGRSGPSLQVAGPSEPSQWMMHGTFDEMPNLARMYVGQPIGASVPPELRPALAEQDALEARVVFWGDERGGWLPFSATSDTSGDPTSCPFVAAPFRLPRDADLASRLLFEEIQ